MTDNTTELGDATRKALNIFYEWNKVTGFVTPHTSYYYELQSIIEDAVRCGAEQQKEVSHDNHS